jgi:protein O-mannosyl-transferase
VVPSLALVLLAIAASATSLPNGFAYDDVLIVRDNQQIHTLADMAFDFVQGYWPQEHGGALYRPLTLVFFSLQWALGRGAPWIFHAVNVALYAGLTLALFALGRRFLPLGAAWLGAALFAVHPVHVEAVANVVGQAELTTALLILFALWLYLEVRRRPALRARESVGLLLLLTSAALCKENGIILPALLLWAEATLVHDPRPLRLRVAALLPTYLLLIVGAVLLMGARHAALGATIGEYPALVLGGLGVGDRLLTMLGIVPEWGRLFVWPAHLRADYAPPEFDAATHFGTAQALGLGIVLLAALAAVATWRRHPAITFGIGLAALALLPVSNLIMPTGILIAERTLLLPSVGVAIAAAGLAALAWNRLHEPPRPDRWVALAGVTALLVLGVTRSAIRQPSWRDTPSVLTQLVQDAPLDYRAWLMYGGHLRSLGRVGEAKEAMVRAASLYHRDGRVYEDLGQLVRFQNGCARAVPIFRRGLAVDPGLRNARGRLYVCLLELGDTTGAMAVAAEGARRGQWFFQLVMLTGPRRPSALHQ